MQQEEQVATHIRARTMLESGLARLLGLVVTKLLAVFAMRHSLSSRQCRRQQPYVHPGAVLHNQHMPGSGDSGAPISQVTQPSLHPMSSTVAPSNRSLGRTASLGSLATGRLE